MIDKKIWNNFVSKNGPRSGAFLQSWEWGEFQKAVGEKVRRKVYREKEETVGVGQWIDRDLSFFGNYSFCPKGPIGKWQPNEDGQMFLRVEANDSDLSSYAKKTIDLNPANTIISDLSVSEEELLASMHHKTRYNIGLARRHGVHIHVQSIDFEDAWNLFEQTAVRGQFKLHARDYYEKMLETLTSGQCRAFLATASYEHEVIAANIMIDFNGTRTYLHGASGSEHRKIMAPYLLHWELMRDAKTHGLNRYDWWGVAPEDAKHHPWSGISRFKRGFHGEEVSSPGTFDLVKKSSVYKLYKFARKIRRKI